MKNQLDCKNQIQKYLDESKPIIGLEVIGNDGLREPYMGVIREVSVYNHKVLGALVQVWVEWFVAENTTNHLTPYFPRQFKQYQENLPIGVFIA